MKYINYNLNLSEGQKTNMAKSYANKAGLTLRLAFKDLHGTFPLMLTESQVKKIEKAKLDKKGIDLKISKTQMVAQKQSGGFLSALAPLLRTVLPKIMAPLATGALSGLADAGIKKIFGNGIVIPYDQTNSILSNAQIMNRLTPTQIKNIKGRGLLKLTQKQRQDGGFLGILAALGIPIISSLVSKLMGQGLQIDSVDRYYHRGRGIQMGKKKG